MPNLDAAQVCRKMTMMWKWNKRWNLFQKTCKTFSLELCLVLCRDVMWHFCLHVLFLFFITLIVTNAHLDERIGNQTLCFKTFILTLPLCYNKNFQTVKLLKFLLSIICS